MNRIYIYTPQSDAVGSFRGSGRILQILKENLTPPRHPELAEGSSINGIRFINDLSQVKEDNTLLIPSWNPFQPPLLNRRITNKQYIIIFDVIPLKYPDHFPIGIRGSINLWRNKNALRHFDKIITISEHSKKDIVQYLDVPEDKIDVIYPAISKNFLTSKYQVSSIKYQENNKKDTITQNTKYKILNTKYCLYVGDVNWNKNLVNLARAIKKADIPCVFVGKPFSQNTKYEILNTKKLNPWLYPFRDFLKEMDNNPNIILAGYVEDSELVELYKRAVCNVLVSRDEGFGYSYAEAASQQCPSVLSDIDVFHETAEDTALFANPNNPDDIAKKISEFSSNETLRKDLGKKAYDHATKLYSPDVFTKKLLAALLH